MSKFLLFFCSFKEHVNLSIFYKSWKEWQQNLKKKLKKINLKLICLYILLLYICYQTYQLSNFEEIINISELDFLKIFLIHNFNYFSQHIMHQFQEVSMKRVFKNLDKYSFKVPEAIREFLIFELALRQLQKAFPFAVEDIFWIHSQLFL